VKGLEYKANRTGAKVGLRGSAQRGGIYPSNLNGAAVWLIQGAQTMKERAFAGATLATNGHYFAWIQIYIKVIKHVMLAESTAKTAYDNQRVAHLTDPL
jgi:hypothetical protein